MEAKPLCNRSDEPSICWLSVTLHPAFASDLHCSRVHGSEGEDHGTRSLSGILLSVPARPLIRRSALRTDSSCTPSEQPWLDLETAVLVFGFLFFFSGVISISASGTGHYRSSETNVVALGSWAPTRMLGPQLFIIKQAVRLRQGTG